MVTGRAQFAKYYLFALLCLCSIVAILDRQALNVLVGPIRADLGISDLEMSVVQGPAFGVVFALCAIPLAYFADKGSRRMVIAMGLLVWGAATIACGLAVSLTALILGRMALALGEAALTPASHALVAELFPRNQLSRALGAISAAANMSAGLSVFIAGGLTAWLATESAPAVFEGMAAWRIAMIIIALPAPILALALITTTRDPPRSVSAAPAGGPAKQIWLELSRHNYYLLLVIAGFGGLAANFYAQMAWFPSYLIRVHQMPLGSVSLQFGMVVMASGVIGPLLGGYIADALYPRFGTKAPIITLVGATAASLPQALAPLADTPGLAMLIFGIGSVCFTANMPLGSSIIQLTTSPSVRSRVSAVWLCVFNLIGLGLGPVLVPLAAKHVFGTEMALGPALVLCSSMILLISGAIFVVALTRHVHAPAPEGVATDLGAAAIAGAH